MKMIVTVKKGMSVLSVQYEESALPPYFPNTIYRSSVSRWCQVICFACQ
jgi:hypothetical protein